MKLNEISRYFITQGGKPVMVQVTVKGTLMFPSMELTDAEFETLVAKVREVQGLKRECLSQS
jgi:hypothetical protein